MKRFYWLMAALLLIIAGCGGVEWFPETTGGGSGSSSATTLSKAFSPNLILAGTDPAVPDTSSTLTFTILNGTGNPAHSGLGFTDQLPAGLALTAPSQQCGGTVSTSGSTLTFTGGSLAAGAANCTITAVVTGAANGNNSVTYTNGASAISGLAGGLVNGVTDQTLKIFPFSKTNGAITASNITPVLTLTNVSEAFYDITVDVTNTGATAASVTVDVVALDASGLPIASTATAITGTVQPGGLIQLLQVQNFVVPLADSAKIKLWTIFSVL